MAEGVKNLKEKKVKRGRYTGTAWLLLRPKKPQTAVQGKILLELNNCPQKKVLKTS